VPSASDPMLSADAGILPSNCRGKKCYTSSKLNSLIIQKKRNICAYDEYWVGKLKHQRLTGWPCICLGMQLLPLRLYPSRRVSWV
jgi:hypothetical protein